MTKRNWIVAANVVALFVGVPLAFALLAFALVMFGPFGVVVGFLGVVGVVFLLGLSHEWLQNWRAERRRLLH